MLREMRINIRSKIAIGYLLIICCLGVSIVVVTERIASLQEEIGTLTSRDIEIHNLIASIRYHAISMESSQRGYLITGSDADLVPYTDGKAKWEAGYNSLSQLISQQPGMKNELEEIKLTIEKWIDEVGDPAIELRKRNDSAGMIRFFTEESGRTSLDALKERFGSLTNRQIESTRLHILGLDNRNRLLTVSLYVMLAVVAAVAFLIVSFVSGSIVNTIKRVVKTIAEIASAGGDLTARIEVRTKDEIKDLADATNQLLASLETENWIKTKVAEVATMNQGITELNALAEAFLAKVAPIVDAAHGLFYIREGSGSGQRLVRIASYASDSDASGRSGFRMGEGLIGQCAQDKRPFLLNKLPEHDVKIVSGLARVTPQSLLVFPIEFEGKVEAVVEFASVTSFSTQHLKLLEQIEDHFGVALNNVAGRMEVERLLSESRQLTEELQAQTEELQTQSEELQLQQEEMRITSEHLAEQKKFAERKTRELESAQKELEAYSEELRKSSQYKSNFLANMSHELRTPLNSILILSQLLSENENGTLSEEEAGYAAIIHTSGNDLLALIDDILDLSKVEAGKITLTIDEVNVSEIPEQMKLRFDSVANSKGLAFDCRVIDGVPPLLHTDGQRLQQILTNLLSNAFKFTERGSVALTVRSADPHKVQEALPLHASGDVLEIAVTDTGIGIPEQKQELIFEAFRQVDGNTNRQYGGTGLGLSICREFAKLLGGTIELTSRVGEGSTFTLYVPSISGEQAERLASAYEEAAAAVMMPETPHVAADRPQTEGADKDDRLFKGKRVLLVEDDDRNVYALVRALEQKAIEVKVAGNGKECLRIMKEEPGFDLVLMDVMMPVMDGLETMGVIRRDPALKDTPIIALTAKAMKSDREKCLEAGASDYISKPLNMEQLFSLMRVWLTKQVGH
ncbi:ATP-binding protein [Paenibacillus arenilitoris]|uniref:Circadian input-output histidine kinase CikA n=1 Tax=Paenibacillus arenilitoris TaxID=2772299 RepID=A0A927CIB7_9BACL|nr:ATP-binding protein [Paenibacillus arenilitoris]MBD2868020.1 response regulator [Paenibacillus arenilitoris]